MAGTNGRQDPPLNEQLQSEPHRFDFFQAVRILERQAREQASGDARSQRQPVGQDRSPDREIVRFRAVPSLSFPAAPISQLRAPATNGHPADANPPEMLINFFGLTGPVGVLPHHYSLLLMRRAREKDHHLRDFFDLFNHRLISLFYRAWEKYRLPFAYERSQLEGGRQDDLATQAIYALVGLGTGHLRQRLGVNDEAFLHYAGLFAHFPRSAVSLERLLGDYFDLPVRLVELQGQWLRLTGDDRSLLPSAERPGGLNCQLGVDLVVGEQVWDIQSKFRIRLGPLTYRQFQGFLPNGDALRPLSQLVRAYVGADLDFDVQPLLRPEEVPWCRLGGSDGDPSYLGWNTWVRCQPFGQAVEDTVFWVEDA